MLELIPTNSIQIKASGLRAGDVIIRKHGARRDIVRAVVRFGLGTVVTVQYVTYDWDQFSSDRILTVVRS